MSLYTNHNSRTCSPDNLDTELEYQEYFGQHFPTLFNDLKTHPFQPLSPQSESSSSYGSTSPSDDNGILDVK